MLWKESHGSTSVTVSKNHLFLLKGSINIIFDATNWGSMFSKWLVVDFLHIMNFFTEIMSFQMYFFLFWARRNTIILKLKNTALADVSGWNKSSWSLQSAYRRIITMLTLIPNNRGQIYEKGLISQLSHLPRIPWIIRNVESRQYTPNSPCEFNETPFLGFYYVILTGHWVMRSH